VTVTTYVLLHGADSDSWYWHLVSPRLQALGHDVVSVDLPCDDDGAGLREYADALVDATGDRRDLIVVAQSLAGFTAPLVCDRLPVTLLVLVAAMVPMPGESPGDWWVNTGHEFPDPFDAAVVFAHDLPSELAAASLDHVREQSATPFEKPWPSTPGPTCRPDSCSVETTASFRPSSSAGLCGSGSGSSPTKWAAAIWSPSTVLRSSSSAWRPTASAGEQARSLR
jgi:pimeloyl-ACP methyl ester carboxylesterase